MRTQDLTVQDVKDQLTRISGLAGDDETAHFVEDELHQAVLEAIANGTCDDPQEAARLALTSKAIHFARWYA